MYDDLARSQRPSSLEWLVVNAVIPSVLVTLALQITLATRAAPTPPGSPLPDAFPTLISMPRPGYPAIMRRLRVGGRVVLRALVNARGRVEPSSILAFQATDSRFIERSRRAVAAALFRPARFGGQADGAWITIAVDFDLVARIPDRFGIRNGTGRAR
jgi:TonB family protein